MVFGRQVGRQNGPKIDSKKHGKKHAKKDQFFNALGGGAPCRGHPGAEIFRPPKTLKSKKNTKPKTRYRYRYKYRYRYRYMYKYRYKYRYRYRGKWARSPTHAVAQSAVADYTNAIRLDEL